MGAARVMGVKIKGDGAGNLSIFTYGDGAPENDLPHSHPLDHLPRLRFHSGLNTPRIVQTVTASVDLGGSEIFHSTSINRKHDVAAHGQLGIPLVMGWIVFPGGDVPLVGSVPLSMNALSDQRGLFRWVTLGADGSNIVLHENTDTLSLSQGGGGISDVTLNLRVLVFDLLMNGADPGPGASDYHFQMTPAVFRARRGAFDTSFRYLRAGSPGASLPVPLERSSDIRPNPSTAITSPTHVRYDVAGYVRATSGNPSSFSAIVQQVKT